MAKKSQDFSMETVQQLANSPAGQQLKQLLQTMDNEKMLLAEQQAAAGAYGQAGKTLQAMLSAPEVQELIKKLGG